jgi:hypothetical protein
LTIVPPGPSVFTNILILLCLKRAKWGMDANANDNLKSVNATNNSRVSGAVDQHRLNALGDDEDCNQDDNPGLTKVSDFKSSSFTNVHIFSPSRQM